MAIWWLNFKWSGRAVAVLDPDTATLSFLHDDRLGTPQLATDSGQNIAWQTTYDPFGNTGSIGGTITQDLRLPGQVFDPIGGEYLNGFRDYLPLIGRYIEPDPLAMQGSARLYDPSSGRQVSEYPLWFFGSNGYTYVDADPLNEVDLLGLCPNCRQSPAVQSDISQMRSIMQRSINEMDKMGRANMPPGHVNGWINNAVQTCRGIIGKTMWGCVNQANYLYSALTNAKFKADWEITKQSRLFPPHNWVQANTQPGDGCPATVTLDPWADEFEVH